MFYKLNTVIMVTTSSSGSELRRLKELKDYNEVEFNKLYKICTPLIKQLVRNIDHRRLNVSQDIVKSYFYDKFLYIYTKYHKVHDYDRLKGDLLVGLKKYSYKLMREGYTQKAEFNQSLVSFENLYDDSKEDIMDEVGSEETDLDILNRYMREHLTDDEYIIYEIILDPPPFIAIRMEDESKGKLSILHLIDFFEFPRTRRAYHHFNKLKTKVLLTLEEAKLDLRH